MKIQRTWMVLSILIMGALACQIPATAPVIPLAPELPPPSPVPLDEVTAPVTVDTAGAYSHLFLQLKRDGKPIPVHDVWIAAQAPETGAVLVTLDRHFEHVGGLRLWPPRPAG